VANEVQKATVTVTPELIDAINDAARFYENVADGQWLVYNRAQYRYFNPDLAVMRDKGMLFHKLAKELAKATDQ
jgi:hypothetical protein